MKCFSCKNNWWNIQWFFKLLFNCLFNDLFFSFFCNMNVVSSWYYVPVDPSHPSVWAEHPAPVSPVHIWERIFVIILNSYMYICNYGVPKKNIKKILKCLKFLSSTRNHARLLKIKLIYTLKCSKCSLIFYQLNIIFFNAQWTETNIFGNQSLTWTTHIGIKFDLAALN